jgi:hypothetical protein
MDRGDHVGDARASSDHLRIFGDACIPDLASLVVTYIPRLIDLTMESRAEGLDINI